MQDIDEIPEDVRAIFRTAWEIPMRSLIDMAADRGAYIDQSQSLNLFMESPTIGKLSSMYMHAWKQGLKTTYYLRSRPATRINKTTGAGGTPEGPNGGGVPATPLPTKESTEPAATPSSRTPRRPSPTTRRSPAPSRTPSRAKPASDGSLTAHAHC